MPNESYKRWHKPNTAPNAKTHQGYYKLENPDKYVGEKQLIIFRSGWEYSFLKWCDASPSVIKFSSEPLSVKYYDKISKLQECKKLGLDPNNPRNWAIKNYNIDFWVLIDKGNNITEKWFIEIKPKAKLAKPIPPKPGSSNKEIKRFNMLASEYLINQEKFKAMNEFALKNNAKFYVFTEIELAKICGRFFNLNS